MVSNFAAKLAGLKKMWCIPPKGDPAFICAMEDVLEVYQRPYDPMRPQVCLDEGAKQILSEVREPIPMLPGQIERMDNEYKREGTCALFMLFEPLAGKRTVLARERRTCQDYAIVVRYLCDEMYPDADKIVLVQDNLNPAAQARAEIRMARTACTPRLLRAKRAA